MLYLHRRSHRRGWRPHCAIVAMGKRQAQIRMSVIHTAAKSSSSFGTRLTDQAACFVSCVHPRSTTSWTSSTSIQDRVRTWSRRRLRGLSRLRLVHGLRRAVMAPTGSTTWMPQCRRRRGTEPTADGPISAFRLVVAGRATTDRRHHRRSGRRRQIFTLSGLTSIEGVVERERTRGRHAAATARMPLSIAASNSPITCSYGEVY